MKLFRAGILIVGIFLSQQLSTAQGTAKRIVILKVDGISQELLEQGLKETDPATGGPLMPWFQRIFYQDGLVFKNFYSRGISLSAPSWSVLDTGEHTVIRGNVEYDRYTGRIYDYLNFFPFYVNYARKKQVDMPGVEVLDRTGIPLVIDRYPYPEVFQSFQLLQRGVRWQTLKEVLVRRIKSQLFLSPVEGIGPESLDTLLEAQTEDELKAGLLNPNVLYLDFYTGDVDHEGHATSQPAALFQSLHNLDSLAGRLWKAIGETPQAKDTLFVTVSDHGMNNVAGLRSQSFSLPDFFNGPAGGAHHVITNRHPLSDYKLRGLYPFVQRVISPSNASAYLAGQARQYPTVWLDLDGNERASVQLRSNSLNQVQILLQQLARHDLAAPLRQAAARYLSRLLEMKRPEWKRTEIELTQELSALRESIAGRRDEIGELPHKVTGDDLEAGIDKDHRRLKRELSWWERESESYTEFLKHRRALLRFEPRPDRRFSGSISDLVEERHLGDRNSVYDLQNYVVGPGASGLVLASNGELDDERSFRRLNYFPLLLAQAPRNSPQPELSPHPLSFATLRLPEGSVAGSKVALWLYGSESQQLLILVNDAGQLALRAVSHLVQDASGSFHWNDEPFHPGLPLHFVEDANLSLPAGATAQSWLGEWHSEHEWLLATHRCEYSTAVIGLAEQLSPVAPNVHAHFDNPVLLRYEQRRRQLVQPDFQLFASSGWNFNARNFNPGGNHGGFYRLSTHAIWMMAGDGIRHQQIDEPYDGLSFASTILLLVGKQPPHPENVIPNLR